jgi:hypothetical protein
MPSKVDIANRALDILGQSTITAIGSAEAGSEAVDRNLQPCFEEVARLVPFRCLTKRAILAASATAPVWQYSSAYPLPSDCLALLDVYKNETTRAHDWILEGSSILCTHDGALYIRYTKQSTDPNEWDTLLQSAVAHRLAVELCELFTTSPAKLQSVAARYAAIMKQAGSRSAKEAIPRDHTPVDSWEQARWYGYAYTAGVWY